MDTEVTKLVTDDEAFQCLDKAMAISIGNSTICIGMAFNDSLQIVRISAKAENLAYEIKSLFSIGEAPVNRCIISSVNPDLTDTVDAIIRPYCRSKPIAASMKSGFLLDYSYYDGLLGIDRAVCCEAAYLLKQAPFIMIDLGTATTINAVDDKKRFIGGMILPGVQMGLSALSDKTALLPRVDLQPVAPLLGRNTKECILAGAIHGTAMLLDNAIASIWTQLGMEGSTILTGGNAPAILSAMHSDCYHEENLIIKGLFAILNRSKEAF